MEAILLSQPPAYSQNTVYSLTQTHFYRPRSLEKQRDNGIGILLFLLVETVVISAPDTLTGGCLLETIW